MKVPYRKSDFGAQIDYKKLIEEQASATTRYNNENLKQNNKVMKKTRSNKRFPNVRRGV